MDSTTNTNDKTITIADLWRVFLVALPLMLIVAVLVCGIGFVYRKLTYKAEYTSVGSFLIMRDRDLTTENLSTGSEVQLALLLTETCNEIMRGNDVFEETAASLVNTEREYSVKYLSRSVSTVMKNDSLIITIRATADSPEEARRILQTYMQVSEDIVETNIKNDIISVCAQPNLPNTPSSSFGLLKLVLFGFLGALLVYGVYFVLDLLDDRIYTEEDIAAISGLTILGSVPDATETKHAHSYRYYRYGKKYGGQYSAYANKYVSGAKEENKESEGK